MRAPARPVGPVLQELGARDANQEDRRIHGPLGEVLDQVEERGLGPVNVLEEDDQGPFAGERHEQASGRPEDLLTLRFRRDADRVSEAFSERPRLLSVGEQVTGRELTDDLA